MMYILFGSAKTRAFRPLWALEEMELEYSHYPLPPRSDEIRALNPSGKVPLLQVEGANISDSTAMITYLADKHGKLTYPAGTIERAQQDALTHMLLDEFDANLWVAARHSFVLPEEHRVPAIKDSLRYEFAASAEQLAARIQGPFLMGEQMTIPDIIATHCLSWARGIKFPLEQSALLEYHDNMTSRPAHKRVKAAD